MTRGNGDGSTVGRAIGSGTVMMAALCGLVLGVMICCGTVWVIFGPVNYFGCGLSRPSGITSADLVGGYAASDGGTLQLSDDGTFIATRITDPDADANDTDPQPLAGPGSWKLLAPDSSQDDIDVRFAAPSGNYPSGLDTTLDIGGSRTKPILYWYVGDPDSCDLYQLNRV